jgi:hypothetical protein
MEGKTMKTLKLLAPVLTVIACLALCGAAAASPFRVNVPDLQQGEPAPGTAALPAALTSASPVIVNEMLPNPSPGHHQWVELHRPGPPQHRTYLPLVLRNAGSLTVSSPPPAAADTSAQTDPDISGWQVTNKAGQSYTIPEGLPPVPAGSFVLIRFDGAGPGADDTSFADGVAILHTPPGLVDTFNPAADQVALYAGAPHNSQTIRDYVAYGAAPGAGANDAIAAGLWGPSSWIELLIGSGAEEEGGTPPADRSIGLYPGHTNLSPDDWAVYTAADLTPGAANPVPRSTWSTIADGAVMASDGFALGWMFVPGATYQLQIDDDPAFGSPLANVVLPQPYYQPQTPPPGGSYSWRVRAILGPGQTAAWSAPAQFTILTVAALQGAGGAEEAPGVRPEAEVVLSMTWLRQRKDNKLLCLDGDNEGNPATSSLEEAWDEVHPDGIYTHGRNSCVRASIAMIVTHYGGNLSMDRIGYRQFENWGSPMADIGEKNNPLRDLGHDRTTLVCGGDGSHGGQLLAWALGINVSDIYYNWVKPSFNDVKGWIDASRPIMRFDNGHQTVIGGYRTLGDGTQQIRLFDPWSGTTWENYSTLPITCFYVPPVPASVTNPRSDEPAIWSDADGDGIKDWDEQNRFHTMPAYADSDDDWVRDKKDLREYVFDTAGAYSLRTADTDSDGQRKELDADNDNDGAVDGCEDTNRDGKYEPASGETDNFSAASHQACTPVFDILQPTETNPVNAGAFDSPDKILVQVKTATPPSSPVTYTTGDFTVRIGGLDSSVVAAYRSSDTHFLVVTPPAQSAADYYDLEVTLGSQTDKEKRAVFYLPKLNADQVLVIDRSGSMSDDGKLEAAKNAARAFIDHSNVDDMIGVVSFDDIANVEYPLTMVTGDTEWNAAKAAVNTLAPGDTTALGAGTRLGYDQVITGKDDHDWSLALLSDGMENEPPYWSDPTVSGVIVPSRVVVHTVALGSDADTALLGKIAAATDGRAFQAGVGTLPPAPVSAGLGAPAADPPGPNLPTTLPNRLADIYKAIGEVNGHQQRVWERTGSFCEKLVFEVPVEKDLPEAIFTVNWDDEKTPITMILTDPDGNTIKDSPPEVREIVDATHHQFRILKPMGGAWVVDLRTNCANYLFTLSARSQTSMHLGFGQPPEERTVGSKILMLVVLADEKPIPGATVVAFVQGPDVEIRETVQFYDDGLHMDGEADDGVYGGAFTMTKAPGQYYVKASAWGDNNYGEFFARHRTGGFAVLPRVGYLWLDDLTTAVDYRDLLQADGYSVDFIQMDDVAGTNWGAYNLIVVGPDTGYASAWGTPAAVGALQQYPTPILGLGFGGSAFFDQIELGIGWGHGWLDSEASTFKVDPAHDVWRSPYAILSQGDLTVRVYNATPHIGIYVPQPPSDMVLIGRESANAVHYNLVQQVTRTNRYLLWGFQAGPPAMTDDGRHLFVNMVRYLAGM